MSTRSPRHETPRRRWRVLTFVLLLSLPFWTSKYFPELAGLAMRADYFVTAISSAAQFDKYSIHSEGIIKTDALKFLIDNRGSRPKTYFMNEQFGAPFQPEYVRYHFGFAIFHLNVPPNIDAFHSTTYFTNDLKKKKFIAGTIQKYQVGVGPRRETFYGIQFYPQDQIAEESILFAITEVRKVFNIPGAQLAYVQYGTQQTVHGVKTKIEAMGLSIYSVSDIYADIPYIAMNRGEAWGYLRVYPRADNLNRNDIPVFKELPLDLAVVAGTITTVVQDAGSHINLKSRERKTPNMVLRDEKQLQDIIRRYEGRPIRLEVYDNSFVITDKMMDGKSERSITDRDIEEHSRKSKDAKPWVEYKTSSSRELQTFDEMAAAKPSTILRDGQIFGGKALGLGFIAHKQIAGEGSALQKNLQEELRKELGSDLIYRITAMGFGVPTGHYVDFVNHPGNAALKDKLQVLIDSEMSRNGRTPLKTEARNQLIGEIQSMFLDAKVPRELVSKLEAKIGQFRKEFARTYPKSALKKVKVRSSANAEDTADFDGAGLYESFSAKLKDGPGDPDGKCRIIENPKGVETKREVEPETLMCAVKAVYASLWTRRAVEERSFARISHATAAMGLAINQKYNFRDDTEGINEVANAVIMTRILAADRIFGYQISLNTPDNLVTNPTPGTQSEIVLASFFGKRKLEFTVTQYAKTEADKPARTNSLVDRRINERMVEIAQAVEIGYCNANPKYFPRECSALSSAEEKPRAMVMEFKIFSNGEVLLKQAREFNGQ